MHYQCVHCFPLENLSRYSPFWNPFNSALELLSCALFKLLTWKTFFSLHVFACVLAIHALSSDLTFSNTQVFGLRIGWCPREVTLLVGSSAYCIKWLVWPTLFPLTHISAWNCSQAGIERCFKSFFRSSSLVSDILPHPLPVIYSLHSHVICRVSRINTIFARKVSFFEYLPDDLTASSLLPPHCGSLHSHHEKLESWIHCPEKVCIPCWFWSKQLELLVASRVFPQGRVIWYSMKKKLNIFPNILEHIR